jgi:hypothetical protein
MIGLPAAHLAVVANDLEKAEEPRTDAAISLSFCVFFVLFGRVGFAQCRSLKRENRAYRFGGKRFALICFDGMKMGNEFEFEMSRRWACH